MGTQTHTQTCLKVQISAKIPLVNCFDQTIVGNIKQQFFKIEEK